MIQGDFRSTSRRTWGLRYWDWEILRSSDQALVDLLENRGQLNVRDQEITDRMVAQTLFRERWARRLRIHTLVWRALKRYAFVRYMVVRDWINGTLERIANREQAIQEKENPPAKVD